MKKISRREVMKMAAPLTAGLTGAGLPEMAPEEKKPNKKLKLMVVGGHPDDPETACGGIMSLYSKEGHEVVSVYLTRGERGIRGKTFPEAAVIRENEGRKACEIMGARPVFMDQINGYVELNRKRYDEMWRIIKREDPDIVITHWPVDTHPDHRVCSLLVYESWLRSDKKFAFYYFEVETGAQTQNFNPTDYVDITDVIDLKHKACFQHVSQHIEEDYYGSLLHGEMEIFRGMESGFKYAEAFVRHWQSKSVVL